MGGGKKGRFSDQPTTEKRICLRPSHVKAKSTSTRKNNFRTFFMNQHFPYQPKAVVIQWRRKREGLANHKWKSNPTALAQKQQAESRKQKLKGMSKSQAGSATHSLTAPTNR